MAQEKEALEKADVGAPEQRNRGTPMDLDAAAVDAISRLQLTCAPNSDLWRGYEGLKKEFQDTPTYARKREMLRVLYEVLAETEKRATFTPFSGEQKTEL